MHVRRRGLCCVRIARSAPCVSLGRDGAARRVQRQDQATPYSPCMTSPSRRLFPSSSWMIRACAPFPSRAPRVSTGGPGQPRGWLTRALPCPYARALSHILLSVRFMPCVRCVPRQLPAAAVPSSVLFLSVYVRECERACVCNNRQFTLASVVGRPTCVALTESGAIVGKRAEVSLDRDNQRGNAPRFYFWKQIVVKLRKKKNHLSLLTRTLQVRSAKRCQDVLCAYRQMLYGMEGTLVTYVCVCV